MLITQTISWPAVNWPSNATATQYTVLQVYLNTAVTNVVITSVTTTSAEVTYDDTIPVIFQIRPTSGSDPTTLTYGPECAVVVNGYVPCRAYLRQTIRQAIADQSNASGVTLNWSDDELNSNIQQALSELNILFPLESHTTITLVTSQRQYDLPTDFYLVKTCEYVTVDGKLHLYLKEKPFVGGESTATSYIGYPKLGILLSPLAGRFYPGHYDVYQNQLNLDWDAAGDGDVLNIRYAARRVFPIDDSSLMTGSSPEDLNLLSLRAQMLCWLRVEGQDARLSRWRTRDDGSQRADLPTLKHSMVIKQLYNELVNDRKELRPRVKRLVRR